MYRVNLTMSNTPLQSVFCEEHHIVLKISVWILRMRLIQFTKISRKIAEIPDSFQTQLHTQFLNISSTLHKLLLFVKPSPLVCLNHAKLLLVANFKIL